MVVVGRRLVHRPFRRDVPLADVSPYLTNSLMTTEDSGFMKHHGFITREFKLALIKDLKEGYFKYGASSIQVWTS